MKQCDVYCKVNLKQYFGLQPSRLQMQAARHLIGLKFHWFSCQINFISCCCDNKMVNPRDLSY
ncbi:hypothetical protein T08_12532 [Trichinella sp. T8]|nr:hypothetical protein T08_9341 [Trichinella sp. T8]KRZ83312.1 hypothetical protein T08_12532 [Trichinella sp. T8]